MKPWQVLLSIGGVCLLFGGCAATHNLEYSNGFRDGTIQKASVKGWPWRTKECELALDGVKVRGSSDSVRGGNVFECSVVDNDLWAAVENAPSGSKVRVRYSQKWWVAPWVARTSYIVTAIDDK